MATIVAQATGNYSAPGTWVGGVVPNNIGDIAQTGAFAVTIDVDINIGTGTLQATSTGRFVVTAARTLVCNVEMAGTGTLGALDCSHSTGTLQITGNVAFTGTGNGRFGIRNNGAGNVLVIGNVTGGASTSNQGILSNSTGTITVNGNATGGGGSSANGVATNTGTGAVTINGNANGGSGGSAGVSNSTTAPITVNGNAVGGSGSSAHGINNTSTGPVTVNGNASGYTGVSGGGSGINSSSSGVVIVNGTATGGVTTNPSVWGMNGGSSAVPMSVYRLVYSSDGHSPANGFVKVVKDPSNSVTVRCTDGTNRTLTFRETDAGGPFEGVI